METGRCDASIEGGSGTASIGFFFPSFRNVPGVNYAIKFHPGETAVLLDAAKVPKGVTDPSVLTTLMWKEIKRLSSSMYGDKSKAARKLGVPRSTLL